MGILTAASCILSIAPTVQTPNHAPPTTLRAERELVLDEVERLLERQDFDRLEAIASDFRRTKARFSSGDWKLDSFYAGIKVGRGDLTLQSKPLYFAALDRWTKAHPDSVTPRLATANAYKALAWNARGTGYADTVSEKDGLEYEHDMEAAWKLLREAEAMKAGDPFVYASLVEVGKAIGKPKSEVNECFTKGMALESAYFPLYTTMARYLLPRWGGIPGGVEAFARVVAEKAPEEGDALYAKIAWSVFHETGEEEFDQHEFDWPRIQSGFARLERSFPGSAVNRHALCRLACHRKDTRVASRLFEQLAGVAWNEDQKSVWNTEAELRQWRSWAKGEIDYPGSDALHRAASDGDVITSREILQSGANLDAQDAEGKTALLNAILQHEDETARLLLEAGANPNIGTHKGWTPLHEAVDNRDPDLVRALLEHGASVNAAVAEPKWTPLHLAAQRGFTEVAEILLARKDLNQSATLRNGDTALVQAIRNGKADVVRVLVKPKGAPIELPQEGTGWMPLHYAAHFGNAEIVALLLDAGASVNARSAKGHTALQVAQKNHSDAAVALLKARGAKE